MSKTIWAAFTASPWRRALLVALLLALCGPSLAQDSPYQVSSCRLAYPYDARTGFLTCAGRANYWTFYPDPSARRDRRLPAGLFLVVEFRPGWGCGSGCWTRILRITNPQSER